VLLGLSVASREFGSIPILFGACPLLVGFISLQFQRLQARTEWPGFLPADLRPPANGDAR